MVQTFLKNGKIPEWYEDNNVDIPYTYTNAEHADLVSNIGVYTAKTILGKNPEKWTIWRYPVSMRMPHLVVL